jgi:hypothetical protein
MRSIFSIAIVAGSVALAAPAMAQTKNPNDAGQTSPLALSPGQSSPLAKDAGRESPLAKDPGQESPLAKDAGRESPLANDTGKKKSPLAKPATK